ncbi:MAG: phosphoribosylanthranilate isomerase [Solirubrobacterales bacterium]|nr:phosphoribosylanthranilate isomerase [Solirubrobacterales bacterium]
MMTKICGITRLEDAEAAVDAGAWGVGLNHCPDSPRNIDPAEAERIGAALKRRCEIAGIFVNASLDDVARHADREGLTILQLHGDEGPSFCSEAHRRTGCRVVKAFRVRSLADITAARAFRTDFHLFDAYVRGRHGGTGESFDWELVARRKGGVPAILAGGLTPDNVGDGIAAANPWGVDVSSGVESAPGIKDHDLIASFMAAAERAGVIQRAARDRHRALKRVRFAVKRRTRA